MDSKKNTQNWKQLKCQVLWATLPSFAQLGLVSDPHIKFQISGIGSMITKNQKI